jgi:galactose mutarotase-like enzyme
MIAPELGGWLLRYARPLPGQGLIEALHWSEEAISRYPQEIHAGNPILFPLVGKNWLGGKAHQYRWETRLFEMPQHGFARKSAWQVSRQSENGVTLELADSEATRAIYPFQFRQRVAYRLDQGRLTWEQRIENTGHEGLPFSTGFHPYFQIPLTGKSNRSACFVRIPEAQRVIPKGDWESYTKRPFPAQDWKLGDPLTETVFLTDLAKAELVLVDPVSAIEVVFNFEGAPKHRFVALWTRSAEALFYCLEPWTALPNSFTRGQDLIMLEPGQVFRAAFFIEIREINPGGIVATKSEARNSKQIQMI